MNWFFIKANRTVSPARMVAITGITAAVYAAATWMVAPLSFGAVQFRISEILILLAYVDIAYGPGLILGCAIANLFSPFGVLDVIIGTTATICSVILIAKTKNLFLASLWPTIFCVFVGFELWLVNGMPFLLSSLSVMAGEFVVVSGIGCPVFRILLKNDATASILRIPREEG